MYTHAHAEVTTAPTGSLADGKLVSQLHHCPVTNVSTQDARRAMLTCEVWHDTLRQLASPDLKQTVQCLSLMNCFSNTKLVAVTNCFEIKSKISKGCSMIMVLCAAL